MSATILGTAGPVEQPKSYDFGPSRGVATNLSYRGTLAALTSLVQYYSSMGWEGKLEEGPGEIWTLSVSIGGDASGDLGGDQITESWELLPNKVNKDLLESDCSLANSLTPEDIQDITKALQTTYDDQTLPTFTSNATNCMDAFKLLKAGVKYRTLFAPILRHTFVVPRNMPTAFAFTNMDKVLSRATMLSSEGVPPDFLIPLSAFSDGSVTRSGIAMSYGWYKCMPTVNLTAWSRREMHIEYEFGLWSTKAYNTPV